MRIRFWDTGERITVFNMPKNSYVAKTFVNEVLLMSYVSYKNSIESLINSGNAAYFQFVANENEMLSRVSSVNGAIGYLSKTLLLLSSGGFVREIRIVD
jgi:hypothetical protein